MARTYYKGDDFNAFNQDWVKIELDFPEDWIISKIAFKVGNLPVMIYHNPVFPLYISLTSEQTIDLKDVNTCYLAIFDEEGRKQTLEGSWSFIAENEVV